MSEFPPEPPNAHEAAVAAHIGLLRSIQANIPGFTHIGKSRQQSLNSAASVPDRFLEAAAAACDGSRHLAIASKVGGPELRDIVAFSRAYATFAEELMVLARGVRHTIAVRRSALARNALRAYRVAKSFDIPAEAEPLAPHLQEMKRALGRGRRAKSTTAPVPQPSPAPSTGTTTPRP